MRGGLGIANPMNKTAMQKSNNEFSLNRISNQGGN